LPDKITLDDALSSHTKSGSITIDDALAIRESQMRVGGRRDVRAGEELIPGQGLPGSPNYQPAMIAPRPEPATDANFGAALKSELVEDLDTRRRLVAESIGVPIERVGMLDDKPVFVNDEGKLQYVSGFGTRTGAAIVGNTPEAIGGIVGSFAGSPVIGSAAGATGARGLKRAAAGLIFDEPQTVSGNLKDLAVEGATNLGAGLAGKGLAALGNRGKVVDFSPTNRAAAEAVGQRVKQSTGIDLDLAQASGDRKLISLRAYAARYPGKSAELIQAADEAAEGQFEAATNRVLDMIAKSQPSEVAGSAGVNAAQMTIAAARKNVSNSVRHLYEAAYKAVPEVDRTTKQGERILDFLKLPYFQEAFSAGQKLRALETGSAANPRQRVTETLTKRGEDAIERASTTVDSTSTGAKRITSRLSTEDTPRETPDGVLTRRSETTHTDITRPSLAELDYTKRALDERIEAMQLAGQRQRARALKMKRDEFVAAMDALPNQQWQAARKEYAELAKSTIEPLENGAVGVLAKIKNPKAATAAAKIFQDPNVTPSQIAFARAQINKQDPEAWNGLVRQWMGQRLNAALKETQTGDVVNPAGKFRQAVFGTPQDRAKAAAMLPQGVLKDFEDLMFAAERLASTPIAGSNTMRDTEIKEQLKGTGAVLFRWLTSPRKAVVDAAEQRALEQGTVAITEALLDPAKRSQLKRVVKMRPSAQQAIMITTLLSGQTATKAAADEFSEDRMPLSE
jgi:hypothetical protein